MGRLGLRFPSMLEIHPIAFVGGHAPNMLAKENKHSKISDILNNWEGPEK